MNSGSDPGGSGTAPVSHTRAGLLVSVVCAVLVFPPLNGRTWTLLQGQTSPRVRVLEDMTVRGQPMLILRDEGPRADGR